MTWRSWEQLIVRDWQETKKIPDRAGQRGMLLKVSKSHLLSSALEGLALVGESGNLQLVRFKGVRMLG